MFRSNLSRLPNLCNFANFLLRQKQPLFPLRHVNLPAILRRLSCFHLPKLKSHSGAKKRVFRTGKGKIALKRRGRGHLLQQKSRRQKGLNRTIVVSGVHQRMLSSLAPYA